MQPTRTLPPALARIKEVRRDRSPIEIAFPAHEGLICEDCGFASRSDGTMACGKCGSKSTVWLSQLVHITGKARRSA